ncbi:dodecin family protein [Christiangramia salexigens]|uniref:Dodecin n=1 Tax=Christiangramia salexigens TaxID=1913577 RepID=A0A1L3J361_9FLAO|nr:dodecin family protein [Christiangramia salexigens]APG59571.1 dodecin [Christiangramia salexigens]
MGVIKVIEVIASSNKSFDEATRNAVKEAAKSVKNIKSVYIKEMKAKVENNDIVSYAVNAKISFMVGD